MSDEQPKKSNPEADMSMHIAVNTFETAANLRKMGYDGAADELEKAGTAAAQQAAREGYVEPEPQQPYIPPGWEQKGRGQAPEPATTMGPRSSGGPGGPSEPPEWPEYHEPNEPYRPEPEPEPEFEPPVAD